MVKSIWLVASAAYALVACTSCATLFQGTSEEIELASDPSGASATVNDGHSGPTPYSIHVNRNDDLQVYFSKPGYESENISDGSKVEWGYLVSDIFFTGLIGLAIDGLDGAMFYHSQQMVSAHLAPLPSQTATSSPVGTAPASVNAVRANAGVDNWIAP